jgi:spore maturation protein SpmB
MGLLAFGFFYRSILWDKVLLGYLLGFVTLIGGLVFGVQSIPADQLGAWSDQMGAVVICGFILCILLMAMWQKLEGFQIFISGAKKGFETALQIIPYLVALLCAVGVFRASGLLDQLVDGVSWMVISMGFDAAWVQALPTGLMKPFSGSGARAMLLELMNAQGVDSFAARAAAIMQGSTETTFYVLALYGGAVGITKYRYTVACALLADATAVIAAISIAYWFFG